MNRWSGLAALSFTSVSCPEILAATSTVSECCFCPVCRVNHCHTLLRTPSLYRMIVKMQFLADSSPSSGCGNDFEKAEEFGWPCEWPCALQEKKEEAESGESLGSASPLISKCFGIYIGLHRLWCFNLQQCQNIADGVPHADAQVDARLHECFLLHADTAGVVKLVE